MKYVFRYRLPCRPYIARCGGFLTFIATVTLVHANPDAPGRQAEHAAHRTPQNLEQELELSRNSLGKKLEAAGATPEQRAILIESWLVETAPLQREIQSTQRAKVQATETGNLPKSPLPLPPLPPDSTPLQKDIHEMENEILGYSKTLETARHTPEQRAIQVEAFLAINRRALKELEDMKRRNAIELHGQAPETHNPSGMVTENAPADNNDPPELSSKISVLRLIQTQASKLDPEARAIYLEANLETVSRLEKEISISRKSQTTAETDPSTTKPQSK